MSDTQKDAHVQNLRVRNNTRGQASWHSIPAETSGTFSAAFSVPGLKITRRAFIATSLSFNVGEICGPTYNVTVFSELEMAHRSIGHDRQAFDLVKLRMHQHNGMTAFLQQKLRLMTVTFRIVTGTKNHERLVSEWFMVNSYTLRHPETARICNLVHSPIGQRRYVFVSPQLVMICKNCLYSLV